MKLTKKRGRGSISHGTRAGTVFVAATHDPAGEGEAFWAVHWTLRGPTFDDGDGLVVDEGDFEFGGTNPDFPERALIAGAMAAARAARNLLKLADAVAGRVMKLPAANHGKKPIPARRRR